MRIVQIITRLIVGGAQEVALLGCEGMHDRGHEVTLLTGPPIGPEGSLLEKAQRYGYRVEVIDSMRRAVNPVLDFRTYRALVRRLRELRPDVVHTHSSKAGILGRWAADRAGVPAIIHTIHGLSFTASTSPIANSIYKFAERRTAPVTDRIVCVADAMRRQSLANNIGTPQQYVTVYAGMDTGAYFNPPVLREQVRGSLGLGPEHLVVGTIARLFYLKGHDDLLEAAPRLCAEYPQLRFLWVGDGLLRPEFERRIAEMKLTDRFVLTGLVPPARIPELAAAMDVLVHPSRREGLALALVQAQLAGRPVVTYDIDGSREGLIEGQTGFALPPFDREKLIEHLEVLIRDEPSRRKMGAAGREFAAGRFSAENMVGALEKVYQAALNVR